MNRAYYPIFADLRARACVVVGGGPVAQRKVTTLLRFGARVKVVSPRVTVRLAQYGRAGRIQHVARRFRPGDLKGAWLAIAATAQTPVNDAVAREAAKARVFVNVVDQPSLCSFIAPAIAKRGELVIAVSTGGASPTVAKRLRQRVQRIIGPEYASLVRLMGSLRGVAKRRLPRYADRKAYFDRLLESDVVDLIQAGRTASARRRALARLAQWAKNGQ